LDDDERATFSWLKPPVELIESGSDVMLEVGGIIFTVSTRSSIARFAALAELPIPERIAGKPFSRTRGPTVDSS
jgi:hypothetical protein